jgi:hypothetical protein
MRAVPVGEAEIGETDFVALLEGTALIGLEFTFDFDVCLAKTSAAPVRSRALSISSFVSYASSSRVSRPAPCSE